MSWWRYHLVEAGGKAFSRDVEEYVFLLVGCLGGGAWGFWVSFKKVLPFKGDCFLEDRLWAFLTALHVLGVLRTSAEVIRRPWSGIITAVGRSVAGAGTAVWSAFSLLDSDDDWFASGISNRRATFCGAGANNDFRLLTMARARTGVELLIRRWARSALVLSEHGIIKICPCGWSSWSSWNRSSSSSAFWARVDIKPPLHSVDESADDFASLRDIYFDRLPAICSSSGGLRATVLIIGFLVECFRDFPG